MARDPFAVPGEQSELTKWNYSNPNGDNYQLSIRGDVVKIAQVQVKNHMTKEREWWPDGNAKLNMLFIIQAEDGNRYPFIFSPRSTAADAVKAAMKQAGIPANSWANMAQMCIEVSTEEGKFYQGNPRPWHVKILGPGEAEFEGCEAYNGPTKAEYEAKKLQQQSVGAMQQAMNPQQQWQQQPQYQPQPQQQWQPQPQPQQFQGQGFQTPINVQNPQLQQSMQRAQAAVQMNNGYMQQQPQQPQWQDDTSMFYDQEIPF